MTPNPSPSTKPAPTFDECIHCGLRTGPTITMASGMLRFCPKSPDGHTFRMTEPTKPALTVEQEAREYWQSLPHCCGYPNCNGDLEGMRHSKKCPMHGDKADKDELTRCQFAALFGRQVCRRTLEEIITLLWKKIGKDWGVPVPYPDQVLETLADELEAELNSKETGQ